jgi:hypothetical protein
VARFSVGGLTPNGGSNFFRRRNTDAWEASMNEFKVSIRRGETVDAIGLARVQIETWRDAYVGILSDDTLIDLDEPAFPE